GGGVLVRREDFAVGFGIVAGDFGDVAVHAQEQGIERVAARGKQRTAAGIFARIPTELAVPWADAVVIINLTVMQPAEQTLIDHGFGGEELAGVTALEANASFDAGFLDGLL